MKVCGSFVSGRCYGLWIFAVAFFIRLLPEFLSGPYPVGYDLLAGYAPALCVFPDDAPLRLFGWAWSPLAVYVLWFFWKLSGVDLYLFLKVAGPVFYGMFVLAFYYLLSRGLGWSVKKSFITSLLFLLQPAVLRTGWDQLREELGFVFLFILLAKTKLDIIGGAKQKSLTVIVLSVLVVLSHQLVAILLFVVLLWQFMSSLIRKGVLYLKGFVVFIPSVFVFVWGLYGQFVCPNFSVRFMPIQLPSGTGFFAFTNYFLSDPRFVGGDFFKLLAYVGSLSMYCVAPLVPVAVKGFFKDEVFTPMLVWLCVASYSIVVFPWFAFSYYWWWILLLPVPLTVYGGQALERWAVFTNGRHFRTVLAGVFLMGIIALGYSSSSLRLGYPYAYTYVPSSLLESCVDFKDVPNIRDAFIWINLHLPEKAVIVVPEKFQGFAFLYSRSDLAIRVAPSLLNLSQIVAIIEGGENGAMYAIYNLKEVGDLKNVTENLAIFGEVAIYRLNI
jgi:hypothetical protein